MITSKKKKKSLFDEKNEMAALFKYFAQNNFKSL